MTKPLVTIVCTTYNQAAYVRDALDSFLMQETTFPYEIFVHDDASTDDTVAVVKDYQTRYPGRIRLMEERENQYRSDPKIMEHIMFPLIDAKYIAICQGDDYWLTRDKLQTQVAYLEAHPDCMLCVCGADTVDVDGTALGALAPYETDCDMPMEDMIRLGGGAVATASIVAPTALCRNLPACFQATDRTGVDDAPLQLWCGANGTIRYFAAHMAAYRVNVPGSWTQKDAAAQKEKRIAMHESMIAMLRGFDAETGGRYHAAIEDAARRLHAYEILLLRADTEKLTKPPYREQFLQEPRNRRLRCYLERYCPRLAAAYVAWRRKGGGR